MTGYKIISTEDRLNAFSDDENQYFETLEEARSWKEAFWESIIDAADKDNPPKKSDYKIAFYKDNVHREDYPLFEN